MTRKIKFVVNAARWFDKVNGNTYHSVRITKCSTGKTIAAKFQYGYGNQYQYSALEAMAKAKWLPVKYRKKLPHGGLNTGYYERENNYPIYWNISQGTKRECIANGKV